jgi:hypothetical protein
MIRFQPQMKQEGAVYDESLNTFSDAWVPLAFDEDGIPVSHLTVHSANLQIRDYLESQQADLDGGYMEPDHALNESDLRIAEVEA